MSRRRRGAAGGGHGGGTSDERWLLTYADMITLLLALFIILFAMSTIDPVRYEALRRTLAASFKGNVLVEPGSVLDGSKGVLDPQAPSQEESRNAINLDVRQQQQATRLTTAARQKELERFLKTSGVTTKQAKVISTERGIVIRLAGDVFFESGSARMNPRMERVMGGIARDLRRDGRQISVEGHTDGQPISTAEFPSNLELSGARAITIYRFLQSHGISRQRMRFVGYADTQPVRKPPYAAAPMAENRRVEIVVLFPNAPEGGDTATAGSGGDFAPVDGSGTADDAPASAPAPDVLGPIIAEVSQ